MLNTLYFCAGNRVYKVPKDLEKDLEVKLENVVEADKENILKDFAKEHNLKSIV